MAYVFPDLGEPNLSTAAGCGDSYKYTSTASTITTTSDANYKHTRPRTTRKTHQWKFGWVGMSEDKFSELVSFWEKVGNAEQFSWVNPLDNQTYVVRFANDSIEWQYVYPGWQGTLSFEEV